jgi:saccharopine dehydrogenase-like NADP-dependent oxidoreductase
MMEGSASRVYWSMRGVQLLTLTALLVQHFVPASALRFLVVGGTGRVGASTAKHLHVLTTDEGRGGADLVLAGRSPEAFERSRARILQQIERIQPAAVPPTVTFQPLDIDTDDVGGLAAAMSSCGADCVVHTAGPFQQRTRPVLLEASIQAGLPYVDVCDEPALCKSSKELHARAVAAGTPCVTAAGIWPGASALMAAEAVTKLRELEGATPTAPCAGEEVEMSFFTAGTRGAGATIVSATFLLLCQAALCYEQGEERDLEPWTSPRAIDFGKSVGTRKVWLLDNPDVFTIHDALQVSSLPPLSNASSGPEGHDSCVHAP